MGIWTEKQLMGAAYGNRQSALARLNYRACSKATAPCEWRVGRGRHCEGCGATGDQRQVQWVNPRPENPKFGEMVNRRHQHIGRRVNHCGQWHP